MNPEQKSKLLFIHSGGLGDIILASPVLKALSQSYKLDLLLEKRALAGSNEFLPFIEQIKVFDFKNKWAFLHLPELLSKIKNYSMIISSGSSPLISLLLFLSGASVRIGYQSKLDFLLTTAVPLNKNQYTSFMLADLAKPLLPNLKQTQIIPNLDFAQIPNLLEKLNLKEKQYFLIHPGVSQLGLSKGIVKSPNSAYWQELINKLCHKFSDCKIALIGGSDEQNLIAEINQNIKQNNFINLGLQKFSLAELAHLIKYSKTFICVDSAPLHLAIAVQAQIIALFGPTDPQKLVPPNYPNLKIIQVPNLLCQPCLWNRRLKVCAQPVCVNLQNTDDVLVNCF